MKTCSCLKVLETYAVIEKNLLKVIDHLQYEKKCLILDYERKISNIEKKLMDKKFTENSRLQSLSSKILHQKIVNHELENRLKLVEENLKSTVIGTSGPLAPKGHKISSTVPQRIYGINLLLNELYSKISSKLKQLEFRDDMDVEIQNIFKSLWSEIKIIKNEFDSHTDCNFEANEYLQKFNQYGNNLRQTNLNK